MQRLSKREGPEGGRGAFAAGHPVQIPALRTQLSSRGVGRELSRRMAAVISALHLSITLTQLSFDQTLWRPSLKASYLHLCWIPVLML